MRDPVWICPSCGGTMRCRSAKAAERDGPREIRRVYVCESCPQGISTVEVDRGRVCETSRHLYEALADLLRYDREIDHDLSLDRARRARRQREQERRETNGAEKDDNGTGPGVSAGRAGEAVG